MVWEVLAVWITAVTVPTVLVLAFLRSIRSIGVSAFEVMQKQLKDCHDRETALQCRVETCESELRALRAGAAAPEHRHMDVSLSVTRGSELSLTPSHDPK